MRRALLKTAFALSVFVLTTVFLIPASLAIDELFPMSRRPSGPQGDRLFPAMFALILCLVLANRISSSLFRAVRLTEERWSIFDQGRRRRPG
jgi:hypothetical protein